MDSHDSNDPKQSPADMTAFVQNLLQQMQSRFQTMSDSIVTKNILLAFFNLIKLFFETSLLSKIVFEW
ncbi:putative Heat shock factor binding 1 [Medicago truncatula]|uniref:Putative Heat shock factor binding 1 n=1 Tax=Medicago truncatula TaxID=3880 RepID=A0A396JYN1_MEDTR|nr:putative Heat shock factor binding 1 [Medicago truncatula]